MNIKPLNNKIIVLQEPKAKETEGGLIIPDSARDVNDLVWGKVVRVSDEVTVLKPGERVLFPAGVGKTQEVDGIEYRIMDDDLAWGVDDVPLKKK